jgi:hypothetical protein
VSTPAVVAVVVISNRLRFAAEAQGIAPSLGAPLCVG